MSRRRIWLAVAAAGGLPLLVAACGGGDSSGEVATLPPIATTSTTTTTIFVTTTIVYVKHTVQPGETLFIIADAYGVTMDELIEINEIKNPDYIQAGEVLLVPSSGTVSPGGEPQPGTTLPGQPGTTLQPAPAPGSTTAP
ncbi:MAG: LysM peptidoglycan-binding domain-containing protein [Ilumatobacteraceae bacterium]